MVEYFTGTQCPDDEWFMRWTSPENPFLQWRESVRSIAQKLENALGKPVYYFGDLTFDLDDDRAHRFLRISVRHSRTDLYKGKAVALA